MPKLNLGTKNCKNCKKEITLRITRDLKRKIFCSRSCRSKYVNSFKGIWDNPEIATKMKMNMRKPKTLTEKFLKAQKERGIKKRGKNHPNWKGGITCITRIRTNRADWKRLANYIRNERDKNTCQFCGEKTNLQAHHLIPYRIIPRDDEENLITLCKKCHHITEHKERKLNWVEELKWLIYNKFYPYPYIENYANII